MLSKLQGKISSVLASGTGDRQRPQIKSNFESNVPGMYIVGDLAGAPVIKLAMQQGFELIEHISSLPDAKSENSEIYDLIIVGGGASGLNTALAAQEKGLSCIVLEKGKIANTIENFPEGKWVYAEPDDTPPKGKLWLDGAKKEELVKRWNQIVNDNNLDVRLMEPLEELKKADGIFEAKTPTETYKAKRIVLATGMRGNPRKLKVPGEDREHVYHQLYSPRKYNNENIIVVGGGNSAIEAALTLCEQNKVYLSYRKSEFGRIFKDNERLLNEKVADGSIELVLSSNVTEFGEKEATLTIGEDKGKETRKIEYDHAFVLIGADVPVQFLKSLGIKLENEWEGSFFRSLALSFITLIGFWFFGGGVSLFGIDLSAVPQLAGLILAAISTGTLIYYGTKGDRYSWLGVSFLIWYSIYGIKVGKGHEFWPYKNWGYELLSLFDRPWAFWYTVIYTGLMTVFGVQALKKWGLDKKDKFQIWRFISLISFQWIFFFLIPEFFFQWAVKYQWVGEQLASNPTFADQAWRSYGIVYAWPLFFYTFFYNPHSIWIVWGVILSFVIIPIFVLFNGKRYCSWICGCGGLAETFGDRWRHLAPKGKESIKWEWMNMVILIFAVVVTVIFLTKNTIEIFRDPGNWSLNVYRILVDVWLVGIIPVTLYPFLGGKVWCRYWCPLAKMMQIQAKFFAKLGIGKFKINANNKCIACNECSRNCQVGIDVMSYALKQNTLDNSTSSCIGCGICVSVCPMDVLHFGDKTEIKDNSENHSNT